jgi:hypothetical protein
VYPRGLADWLTKHDPHLAQDHKELVAVRTPELYHTLVNKALGHLKDLVNNASTASPNL